MTVKRLTALFYILIVCFCLLAAYLFTISSDGTGRIKQAVAQQHQYTLRLDEKRGTIYDCKMRPLTNSKTSYKAIIDPSAFSDKRELLGKLITVTNESPEKLSELIKKSKPFVIDLTGELDECEGIWIYRSTSRYQTPQIAASVIGYIGNDGKGASGIEKAFDRWLRAGGGEVTASFCVNAVSQTLTGLGPTIKDKSDGSLQGVALTIDKDIQEAAERAVQKHLKSGAVVVSEVSTGKIRALVSYPTFTPDSIDQYLNSQNGEFLNRALLGYNLGSVFKIVVTAAALEKDFKLSSFKYNCKGSITVGGRVFNCHEEDGHGLMDMTSAFGQSCNTYYISLAQMVGLQDIVLMAQKMGLGESIVLAPSLVSQSGNLPKLSNPVPPALIGNLAIGQGSILVTPIQVAKLVNTVAGYGLAKDLSLVEGLVGNDGEIVQPYGNPSSKRVLSIETAIMIRKMMVTAVENGTGSPAKPENGGAGGKTATAETGWVKNGKTVIQAWFAGFYPSWRPQYSIIVLCEDGYSGGQSAGPVFKDIANAIYNLKAGF